MTNVQQERRRAPRARANFPIQIGDRDGLTAALLKDISTNGLCCSYPDALNEMTLVRIDLQIPGQHDAHALQGVVVRCEKKRGDAPPAYELAIYFTDVPPSTRRAIGEFVQYTETKHGAPQARP